MRSSENDVNMAYATKLSCGTVFVAYALYSQTVFLLLRPISALITKTKIRIKVRRRSHPKMSSERAACDEPHCGGVITSLTVIVVSFEFFVSLSASMRAMLVMTVPRQRRR